MAWCSNCLEDVEEGRPVQWTMPNFYPVPTHRHLDGTALCPIMSDEGYRPAQPSFSRLELIAQRTETMQTAEAQRLALVVEALDAGDSWEECITAAGIQHDGMLTDELAEMAADYRKERDPGDGR